MLKEGGAKVSVLARLLSQTPKNQKHVGTMRWQVEALLFQVKTLVSNGSCEQRDTAEMRIRPK